MTRLESDDIKLFISNKTDRETFWLHTNHDTLGIPPTPLQHTATHCSRLQHTATYCSTLQHTFTHSNTLVVSC